MNTKQVGSRRYFFTYLLPTSYTDSELNVFKDEIAKLVTKHKATIVSTDEWGKRKTAYKIRHAGKWYTDAVYVHLLLEMEPVQTNPLEKDIYLNVNIMRHILVVADEEAAANAAIAGQAPVPERSERYDRNDRNDRPSRKR